MMATMDQPTAPVIDLRSDLLARATPETAAAIAEALTERSFFELREDPRQTAAERAIARALGHEDALLTPTCTMANQIALALLTRPGDAVLAPVDAHVLTSEAGAASAIAGVQVIAAPDDPACPNAATWHRIIRTGKGTLRPRVTAIVIENTHNRSGGRIVRPHDLDALLAAARDAGAAAHLDGARLANAAIALGVPMKALAEGFDTVAISLNKGIGAPFGAAIAGSRDLIDRAIVLRQRLGGGLRRMGVLAVAIDPALADCSHIAEDHRRARRLAEALSHVPGVRPPERPETNIVLATLDSMPAVTAAAALARRGVLVLPVGPDRLRLTTYRGVDDTHIDRVAAVFAEALAELAR